MYKLRYFPTVSYYYTTVRLVCSRFRLAYFSNDSWIIKDKITPPPKKKRCMALFNFKVMGKPPDSPLALTPANPHIWLLYWWTVRWIIQIQTRSQTSAIYIDIIIKQIHEHTPLFVPCNWKLEYLSRTGMLGGEAPFHQTNMAFNWRKILIASFSLSSPNSSLIFLSHPPPLPLVIPILIHWKPHPMGPLYRAKLL